MADIERDPYFEDLHARFHDQPGNMLSADDCEWEKCDFWEIAQLLLGRDRKDKSTALLVEMISQAMASGVLWYSAHRDTVMQKVANGEQLSDAFTAMAADFVKYRFISDDFTSTEVVP
jgi:hypothetical protein